MAYSQSTKDEIEQERYEIAKEKDVVVHGARIICQTAGADKQSNYLLINDGHGFMENGNLCAHDGNCIPIKNIGPFEKCTSPEAENALTELVKTAPKDSKERLQAALDVFRIGKTSHTKKFPPCTLQLLDRWFDADEKEIVEYSMGSGSRIIGDIEDLQIKLKDSIVSAIGTYETEKYLGNKNITKDECTEKINVLKGIKEIIIEKCLKVYRGINTKILVNDGSFNDITTELEEAKPFVKDIAEEWEKAHTAHVDLENYDDYKELIENIFKSIQTQIDEIDNWKEDSYHLITTGSFLVCRCGGLITFKDSGQNLKTTADNLATSILTTITQFKEYHRTLMEIPDAKKDEIIDHQWSSHKAAAEGLERFENMLIENGGNTSPDTCIYMELICKSYNDEVNKLLMTALTLISMIPGMEILGIGLAIYTAVTMGNDAQGAADGASATIELFEAIKESGDEGGILKNLGAGALVNANKLYTYATIVTNLLYVSYDTFIENIKVTVFTEHYAYIDNRKLKETGELEPEFLPKVHKKEDYTDATGLKWKEEPGVYLGRKKHMWENRKGESFELKEKEDIDDVIYPN